MNPMLRLAAAALAAGLVLAPAAQAQVPNTPENRAVEAARKGALELRRFIQRTRSVYGLHFEDFRRYLP